MRIKLYVNELIYTLKNLTSSDKKNLIFVALTLFFVLFSYPIIRSTTDAIFLNVVGAKKSPHVWLYSIIVLSFVISIYSTIQKKIGVHRLFFATSLLSALIFVVDLYLIDSFGPGWAYSLFIWKEVYIVLLVGMAFAYLNTTITVDVAKILYGPIGAINSLGGVFGGLLTARLTANWDIEHILYLGCVVIILSSIAFLFTDKNQKIFLDKQNNELKTTPLKSISDIKMYVFLVLTVVALSQFCINIVNFKFYIILGDSIPDKIEKTRFFGNIYFYINSVSLFIQVLIVPFALKIFKMRTIHQFVPVLFMLVSLAGFAVSGGLLVPAAAAFVIFKGVDYSLFSSAKEILYFPLTKIQRYGAKYVIDMVGYRASKGLISTILIFVQKTFFINLLLSFFLFLWVICLIPLFRMHKKLLITNSTNNQ